MAHELYIEEDGQAAMFYTGETPWHRLGTRLAGPATAEEAIKAARLDWEVWKKPIYAVGGTVAHQLDNKYAVVPANRWFQRDCPVFGIVGEDYTPLQNHEAFQFFDPIVGAGAAVYHTAGALGKGERIWILAKLPSDITVVDKDITHKYLLLSNSHDGEGSVQIKFTPVRVVCKNTLSVALSKGPIIHVSHVRDLQKRLEDARENLGIIHSGYQAIEKAFQSFAGIEFDDKQLTTYLKKVFPDPRSSEKRLSERVDRSRKEAAHLFEYGNGNQLRGVAGTLWAAYNGVAEFIDHGKTKRTPEQRLNHIWFGDGAGVKARAFNEACEHIEPEFRP